MTVGHFEVGIEAGSFQRPFWNGEKLIGTAETFRNNRAKRDESRQRKGDQVPGSRAVQQNLNKMHKKEKDSPWWRMTSGSHTDTEGKRSSLDNYPRCRQNIELEGRLQSRKMTTQEHLWEYWELQSSLYRNNLNDDAGVIWEKEGFWFYVQEVGPHRAAASVAWPTAHRIRSQIRQ